MRWQKAFNAEKQYFPSNLKKEKNAKLKRAKQMKAKDIGILALIIAFLDVGVPYLFLRNIARFWASYLFWVLLTSLIIILGIIHIRGWGKAE